MSVIPITLVVTGQSNLRLVGATYNITVTSAEVW